MRPLVIGYFFKHSDRPAPDYGDYPQAMGNCEVVVEPSVVARVSGPLIISPECIGAAAAIWERIIAIYVAVEAGTVQTVNAAVDAARRLVSQSGLPPRPVVSYTGATTVPDTRADWTGVQAYFDAPADADTYAAAIAREVAKVRGRPVALVCQAYDRRRDFMDVTPWREDPARLADLQAAWPRAATAHPEIVALLLFSYGRAGGTKDYPAVEDAHRALLAPAPLASLPDRAPGVTVTTTYPRDFGSDMTLVEWLDRYHAGTGGRVTMERGSLHVELWTPDGSDKTTLRREVRR